MSAPAPPPDPYGAPQQHYASAQPWYGQPTSPARAGAYGGPYAPALTDLTPMAIVVFALATLSAVLDVTVTALLTPALEPGANDVVTALFGAASLLAVPLLLAAFVVSAIWLHQARRNAEIIAPSYQHARSDVWVWLGWIVPVVSLWFPYQVVRDVQMSVTRWSYGVIGWWWGLWVTSTLLDRAAGAFIDAADRGETPLSTAQSFLAITSAVNVAALVCWGLVLRRITLTQGRVSRGEPAIPDGPR